MYLSNRYHQPFFREKAYERESDYKTSFHPETLNINIPFGSVLRLKATLGNRHIRWYLTTKPVLSQQKAFALYSIKRNR